MIYCDNITIYAEIIITVVTLKSEAEESADACGI